MAENNIGVGELLQITQDNASYFQETVNSLVKPRSQDLDDLMYKIQQGLTGDKSLTTDEIESYYAELTNLIYFKGEALESLNIYSDMAKAAAKEIYNKAYLDSSSLKDEKGKSGRTVAENTAIAESQSQNGVVASQIYDHAYRVFKAKIEAATEMIATLKNILKRRENESYLEYQLSSIRPQ